MLRPLRTVLSSLSALAVLAAMAPAAAQGPPCMPCAGVAVTDPAAWAELLASEPRLESDHRLYVAWHTPALRATEVLEGARALADAGATPWLAIEFQAASPILDHVADLEAELAAVAEAARQVPDNTHFQILWAPAAERPAEYAFLLKRAAVTLTGASGDAVVVTTPLPTDVGILEALYAEDVAAYLDGIALKRDANVDQLAAALGALEELDPGKTPVLGAPPLDGGVSGLLAGVARAAEQGIRLTFFGAEAPDPEIATALKVLAREFHGDLAFDPYSSPSGPGEAWSFVRGEDLGLRVITVAGGDEARTIEFSDTTLRRPERIDLADGSASEIFGLRNTATGIAVPMDEPAAVVVLRLQRPDIADLVGEGGVAEELTITTERTIPVEEILRRLQANEDAQDRRIRHYEATNTTHLRLGTGTGAESVETTFRGGFWKRRGEAPDWAWEDFFVNGVRWRNKRIPEIPLLQPEKAATLPLEITFGKEYQYRLRGTDSVEGRDCWVIDFAPQGPADGENLWQGTVWVDRQHFRRVRSKATQVGLEGDVVSNEETMTYTAVDENGEPAEWNAEAIILPLRTVSQQLFSILAGTTQVEKETLLSGVRINEDGFEDRLAAAHRSEATIVRDTEKGLRYLVLDEETNERVVQEEFDQNRLLLLGGVFHDDALDYPLPLGGVNWVSFDLKGSGTQANIFFAGVLVTASVGDPNLFGSRFDGSADLFFLGVPLSNSLFRNGVESVGEEVKIRPGSLGFSLGRPIGDYAKLRLDLGLSQSDFQRADSTDEQFLLPQDHFTARVGLDFRYNRGGWRFRANGSHNSRSDWERWGPADSPFDPDTDTYVRWAASLQKNFHLPRFRRIGLGLDYVGGDRLDRFSKYNFGYFSNVRVHGFQSGKVRAEEATAAHLSYGLGVGEAFRVEVVGDAALATDLESGLDNEFLAGTGLVGQFVGPWQTLVQLDVGVPVAGPEDGFTVFLAFLRLFR